MDKRSRNLGIIIVVVVIIVAAYFVLNNKNMIVEPVSVQPISQIKNVFSPEGYSLQSFADENSILLTDIKLNSLKSKLSVLNFSKYDSNTQALKTYYVGMVDLKIKEKAVLNDVQIYTNDENKLCGYLDELLDVDLNMFDLSSKYAGLEVIRENYLSNMVASDVAVLNRQRYADSADAFEQYYDFVFALCASAGIEEASQ